MKNTRMAFFSFGLPFLLYTLFPFGGTTASAQPADRPRYLDSTDFAADPAAHVFDDKIHVYYTHDWDSPVTDRTDGNPLKANDPHRFFEAAWLHKHNGTYYFTYSTGSTHLICYATGDSPYGPFTYRGVALTPVVGWTTHQSVCEYNGKWHLFFHDCVPSGGISSLRSAKYCELIHEPDGSIRTVEGKPGEGQKTAK